MGNTQQIYAADDLSMSSAATVQMNIALKCHPLFSAAVLLHQRELTSRKYRFCTQPTADESVLVTPQTIIQAGTHPRESCLGELPQFL